MDREDRALRDNFAGPHGARTCRENSYALRRVATRPHRPRRNRLWQRGRRRAPGAATRDRARHRRWLVRPHRAGRSPINELRADHGLPPDPELAMLSRYLVLSPFPPSLRDPAFPLPATAHPLHPLVLEAATDATAPPWIAYLSPAPTVYFTLGTVFNLESGDLFSRVLAGLRDLLLTLSSPSARTSTPPSSAPNPPRPHRTIHPPSLLLPIATWSSPTPARAA
jgi:UDP:flavonoid glycosyltransferase YjiC (YdhE family)